MPSLDGGHYFLTVMMPVRTDYVADDQPLRSHRSRLAQALASLPAGHATQASPAADPPSPFARNTLNHLARFVIIDGPAYNGRLARDTLRDAIAGADPLVPQPVDRFPHPYLLFAADIDAQGMTGEAARRRYTDALWATMRAELADILGHCAAFDGVGTADDFHAYVRRCEVDTTMPFNDYWPHDELKAKPDGKGGGRLPGIVSTAAKVLAAAAAILALAAIVYAVTATLGWHGEVERVAGRVAAYLGFALLVIAVVVAVALFVGYRVLLAKGAKPFPTAPQANLPSVLKSLYLQRRLTRFAIDAQGLDPAALHAAFGDFLTQTRPSDESAPTQAPGALEMPL